MNAPMSTTAIPPRGLRFSLRTLFAFTAAIGLFCGSMVYLEPDDTVRLLGPLLVLAALGAGFYFRSQWLAALGVLLLGAYIVFFVLYLNGQDYYESTSSIVLKVNVCDDATQVPIRGARLSVDGYSGSAATPVTASDGKATVRCEVVTRSTGRVFSNSIQHSFHDHDWLGVEANGYKPWGRQIHACFYLPKLPSDLRDWSNLTIQIRLKKEKPRPEKSAEPP